MTAAAAIKMTTTRGRKLAFLGALVATAVVAAQFRGQWESDAVTVSLPSGRLYAAGHHRGRLVLFMMNRPLYEVPSGVRSNARSVSPRDFDAFLPSALRPGSSPRAWFAGAERNFYDRNGLAFPLQAVAIPGWAILAPALLLGPGRRVAIILRQRRRARGGRCTACGYDLRGAAADTKQCPECGVTVQ